MRTVPLCCLLLAASLAGTAAAGTVYQWKDARGVTHSSDKPPAGQAYQTRRIDQQPGTAATAAPATSVESPQCTTARANLTVLQGSGAIQQDSDGDGKPDRTLSPEERSAQKDLAEAAIKAYCPPAG
ncbi:DUF4124 domain-containing protein [Xanthomonas sp. XNM01]|uniref:DUF4124 domain-containing protein n=1 Tax=Xanthomonas sp. XNM01 TaxID=2769289 RepID=UPI00177C7376|nr:DUF4124 domain-containing protein [Xanthomonas sp. XNM01]MBD9369539.1 DUF4124 domain-containing protein [Xanthomonas sp. XNM01]